MSRHDARTTLFLSAGLSGAEPLADPQHATALVALAESARIDLLVLGETGPTDPSPRFDPLVVAAWLAPHAGGVGLVAFTAALEAEPFHVARAMSALDFLTGGRSGWQPGLGGRNPARLGALAAIVPEQALPKALDFIAATRSLWDSWDADALIIDAASGIYLDPDKVRPCHYHGPFFQVRGPLNAARPPQGHPLLVQTDRDPLWRDLGADVLIVDPDTDVRAGALRSARVAPTDWNTAGLDRLQDQFRAGAMEGLHFALDDPLTELPRFTSEVLPELERRGLLGRPNRHGLLRARLGLPNPGVRS